MNFNIKAEVWHRNINILLLTIDSTNILVEKSIERKEMYTSRYII